MQLCCNNKYLISTQVCNHAFHPTTRRFDCDHAVFSSLLFPLATPHCTLLISAAVFVLFFVQLNCFYPWCASRKMTGWWTKKPQDQIKSPVSSWLLEQWWWAGHGSYPRVVAGSWSLENQYVFLSSLRELCLLLSIAVCHAAERCGHTFSSQASLHIAHDGMTPPRSPHHKRQTCHPPLHTRC